ncbi:11992_t:CDS:10 [Diversispora eburnea]|uniref:11992_t:CDS:1 n=1 Tax=Diversispora eburnea TaxID=1213867 RepID=A0A9N8ZHW8_9GLOM|nr:11992_t:CDS:10 [Diversispora eburnea]
MHQLLLKVEILHFVINIIKTVINVTTLIFAKLSYILVGTTNETQPPGSSLKKKLNLRLEQLEKEEKNLQNIKENLSEIITFTDNKLRDYYTIRERFVAKCLEILEALEVILRNINEIKVQTSVEGNTNEEPDCLGIRDLRIIHTMLEIVISWGIYPCLLPGVGIPISHRTRSGYIQNIKDIYLFSLMKSLTNIIFPTLNKPIFLTTTISLIILEKHFTDIYAALLQLAYANDLKELIKIRKESNIMFHKIFEESNSFQSLNALTMLLSSSPICTSPNWLKNICGQYLTQILLRPNGVKDIMEFMIGDESEVNLSKLETISKLILSVPNTAKSPEAYFSIICPQLLSIVQSFTSSSSSLQNFKSSPTLQSTISTIHYLLIGSEPIPNLLQFFLKYSITPLYYLYSFTCSSKSFLKDIILDILLAYFKIITIDESVKALKEILFRKKNEKLKAPQSSDIGEIYFAPGSFGGVLTGDFFMYVLTEYTSLKSLQSKQQQSQQDSISKSLFTLLNLILAMIDQLGSKILQKPGQMIAFDGEMN